MEPEEGLLVKREKNGCRRVQKHNARHEAGHWHAGGTLRSDYEQRDGDFILDPALRDVLTRADKR